VEGLAVAADPPRSDLSLDEEAAALRRLKLAPDVRKLFQPAGFYGVAGPRAYTLVGAFVLYLRETYGRDKLKAVYGSGDFLSAYGKDLAALAMEWERHLDALPLSESTLSRVTARYRQESLFARPCAREVAELSEKAAEALAGAPEEAQDLYARCAAIQPDDPRFALGRAAALEKLGRNTEADEVLRAIEPHLQGKPSLVAELTLARADLAGRAGGGKEVEPLLNRALSQSPTPEVERTAEVKLYAFRHPALTHALLGYFDPHTEDLRLLLLEHARVRAPSDPVVRYLLGRRLLSHAPIQAATHLGVAAVGAMPEALRKEAWRLWLEALFLAGDCAGVRDAAGRLPDLGGSLRATAAEWQQRCTFEETRYRGPLVPANPFR
jgi:hypothetical protein